MANASDQALSLAQAQSRCGSGPIFGLTYLYRPWSVYRYLEHALQTFCDTRCFLSPYRDHPGFSPEDSVLEMVEDRASIYGGFVFTEECLFAGLTELNCPTAIWFADYWPGDYHRLRYARLFDHVFVSQRDWLGDFTDAGCKRVHWLPFACDREIHQDLGLDRVFEVGFVGNIDQAAQRERVELLTDLSRKYRMNDFRQRAYLHDMARVYSQSRIVVNMPNRGGFNMRVFEAMACGAMLLTEDTGNGQKDLFTTGVHLDVYRTKDELFAKIDYYLSHEAERRAIAEAGKREVLAKHRYVDRARTIVEQLQQDPHARFRSTDQEEIARTYALFYARRSRVQPLLRSFASSQCSLSTRAYIAARLVKTAINVLRSPA
jgi:hypothetical protein